MQVEIKNNKERVKRYLTDYPETRDNYNKLIANIWYHDLKNSGHSPDIIDGLEMLRIIAKGDILTNPESIRRNWQKLQQDYPELRGKTWEKRQGKQSEVKSDLGYQ